jgi:Uncharacterized conserved protein
MRLELAGTIARPSPVSLTYTADDTFDVTPYIEQGYTHFDVICIGAGGGRGGRINAGSGITNYGGAGGGGGFHRVRGLLLGLPILVPIVVGDPGAAGTDHASNPASTTDGGDGEASTFNTTTCRASGGKGGKRAQSASATVATQAHGGEGGKGDRTIAGGGAAGGTSGTPTTPGPGTAGTVGADGSFGGGVGEGGGGGAGGVRTVGGTIHLYGTNGGKGSFNPGDTSVYGSGVAASNDAPGTAGGAKAAPLNGLPTVYGRSGEKGAVVIRLTAE